MAQPLSHLTEIAIRTALLAKLRGSLGPSEALIEELGVENGAARVDVALASTNLQGFEIKSDFDTLDRLARQMHAYHRVFDLLTIVTTGTFMKDVEALLPSWWGIWIASAHGNEGVTLLQHRAAHRHNRLDPNSIAALLWRDEAYSFLLEECGPVIKPKAPRHAIYEAIASQVPIDRIRSRVVRALLSRDALQSRLHVTSNELARGEDEMVAGSISPPCHEAA
jgi:hypothetical protein